MADTKNLGTMVEDPRNPSGEKVRKDWLQAQEKNPVRPLSSDNKIIINPAGRSTESISGFKTPQAVSASDVLQQAQPQLQQTAKQLESKQWLDGWFEKIEQEKQRALAMNEGRRIGTTLGALGRSIGELIQSTNNAPVLPNDIQKQYDALSADQQRIYDTYFARQDMLRKEKQAQDEAEKARQAAADQAAAQRNYDWTKFVAGKQADAAIADERNKATVEAARLRGGKSGTGGKASSVTHVTKKAPIYKTLTIGDKQLTFDMNGTNKTDISNISKMFSCVKHLITDDDKIKKYTYAYNTDDVDDDGNVTSARRTETIEYDETNANVQIQLVAKYFQQLLDGNDADTNTIKARKVYQEITGKKYTPTL